MKFPEIKCYGGLAKERKSMIIITGYARWKNFWYWWNELSQYKLMTRWTSSVYNSKHFLPKSTNEQSDN